MTADPVTIAERLAGRTLLLTGASGFLGKAILATCLRALPELSVLLLLRADSDEAAARRLTDEVLASQAFAGLEAEAEAALAGGRVRALAADFRAEALGRPEPAQLGQVDVVVHAAASVSFEEPLDEMLELNVFGALRLVRALREAGADPDFVHVSTAYAAGMRTGIVLEQPSGSSPAEPYVDLQAELAAARAWRRDLEAESRLPEHQRRFVADAREEVGPAGAPAIGARAEVGRLFWVAGQLTERGRERSRALGWSDAYTLSKALAERTLSDQGLRSLSFVRPSIIESALHHPYPGWIEGLKVADPVILAYGRGLITRFPGDRSVRLDLIPVDFVANACLASAAHPPADGRRTVAVVSGSRNPLTIDELAQETYEYFRDRPLPDDDGVAVEVSEWRFASRRHVMTALDRGEQGLRAARRVLDYVPVPRGDQVERRLHRERRALERFRRLTEIYGPYTEIDCMFDDRHARELQAQLHPDEQVEFGFDAADISWPQYVHEVHLPALRELVRKPRGRRPAPRAELTVAGDGLPAEMRRGIAFFDIEGVVLDANVAEFYAWLRTREMPTVDKAAWMLGLAARAPGYLLADRQSRAAFNRQFYRNYRGLPAAELRAQAAGALSEFILPRIHHAAVRRIRHHRERGDLVILITGALDFLVAPLAHLADELVAARLVERGGAFTGELAEPPLTADGRAALAARLAAERGVSLADCHAYGDSVSDLALLEAVGHPNAVNADFRLAREARRRRWPLHTWKPEVDVRSAPVAVEG